MKSHYFHLWLLLLIGLGIIIVISFIPHDLCIGAHALKKAPIKDILTNKDTLTKQYEESDSLVVSHVIGETEDATISKCVETDSLPKSIFIFGDSMSYNLALRLAAYAAQNGHAMHAINWDSSTSKNWADSDTLSCFLNKYNVDYVFIALGSNEAYYKKPEVRLPYIQKILSAIGDRPYVWIGPPDLKCDASKFNEMMEKVCRNRSFFNSTGISLSRRKDNIHPTREAASLWMDSIARWIPKSNHPILMEYPSDSIKKVNANIISWSARKK